MMPLFTFLASCAIILAGILNLLGVLERKNDQMKNLLSSLECWIRSKPQPSICCMLDELQPNFTLTILGNPSYKYSSKRF